METKEAIVLIIVFNSVSFCKTECPPGTFSMGFECVPCPKNCRDGICDNITGVCEKCYTGFYGWKCNERCIDYCDECSTAFTCNKCLKGYFLHDKHTCVPCVDNCVDHKCSQTDGTCLDGCVKYKYGALCDSWCPINCHCGICNQFSGECTLGCAEGYRGPRCLFRNIENDLYLEESTTEHQEITKGVEDDEKHVEVTTQTTSPDVDETSKTKVTNENWYLYVVMGICLLVTILILVTCVGYIVRSRKKQSQKSEMQSTPSVVYSREYNYIDYFESTDSTSPQNATYFEPQPDGMYDYIADNSFKHALTVSNNSCESDGYLKPTNQNRHYITPVNDDDKSPDVNVSYESLKHNGTTENTYTDLKKK